MAGNIVKWWKHKILGGYKQFSGKKEKNPFVYLIGSRNKQKQIPKEMVVYVEWMLLEYRSRVFLLFL